MTFLDLGINEHINRALAANNISSPTDIQRETIPQVINSTCDIVAVAQTGTGKTAAFSLPILQSINPELGKIQALVLVPTRELGQQVQREFFLFSKFLPRVFAEGVFGGAPIHEQISKLKRATHVVVATPGRLIDLLDKQAINLDDLNYIVLDEADEMMNMGFKSAIDDILKSCKPGVRKLLFTATMPADVKHIVKAYLSADHVDIRINAEEFINQKIEHYFLIYEANYKLDYLKALLLERKEQRGIVFCRTKIAAKRLAKQLAGFIVVADALHGNLNQEMREKVMRGFKKERINLLVATDIAARGIDVKELDYIIHYHLPEKSDQYTHRSGRTARAGKSGVSICLIKAEEKGEINSLESDLNIQFSSIKVNVVKDTSVSKSITVSINMGHEQNFDKHSLPEYLVEEAGLNAADITNVLVADDSAQFDIPEKYEQQLLLNLKSVKYMQRNLKLTKKK